MYQARIERGICLECLRCVETCPNGNLVENYGKPGQKPENECQGCRYCVEVCPTKAIQVDYVPEPGEKIWSKDRLTNIRQQAETGNYRIMGCGTQTRPSEFDRLVLVPAQLSRKPLLEADEVKTSVTIGSNSTRPINLETPIIIGAMSFGALSKQAKIALSRGSAMAGSMANTGEGGMLPEERAEAKYLTVQYSTGRFGITEEVLKSADMIEIKIGQGAKPGLGGHLLKNKITPEIALVRGIEMGKDVISPSRHLDINSTGDLRKKVRELREMGNGVPISIKIAAGHIEEDLEIALSAEPEVIMIDGMEGGTGAAPLIASDHMGIPALFALTRAVKFLNNNLATKKILLGVGGGLRDAADFAKALALGADLVYVGTSALVAIGCRLCRCCHKGVCPNGIATQNELLTSGFDVDLNAVRLANFLKASTRELQMITRMVGKNDVAKLDSTDLRALDEHMAKMTDIRGVYSGA